MENKLTRGVASRIYRNAAQDLMDKEKMESGNWAYKQNYACHALASAFVKEFEIDSIHGIYGENREHWRKITNAFFDAFCPPNKALNSAWFGETNRTVNRNARILALLTMAQNHSIRS